MAFDMLHMLRGAQPLSKSKRKTLAALLDFGACANAAIDHKNWRRREYRNTLQLLDEAGVRPSVIDYLSRLRALENNRPLPGGDDRQFHQARLYREAVVRLSLGMLTTTANSGLRLDEGIRATYRDADLRILFRIVMLCQIIDDVLDYSKDASAGLPSFLTAGWSLPQAFELTRQAATDYADGRDLSRTGDLFPLRSALFLVSICARLVISFGRWKQRARLGQQFTQRPDRLRLEETGAAPNYQPPGVGTTCETELLGIFRTVDSLKSGVAI